MEIKMTFFGAAQNVTGSCYLIEFNNSKILIDCGMYQERDLKDRNYDPFPVPADSIDAVLLTHAHLDHCGRVPRLVREGFRGDVVCTPATADISQVIMKDSAYIQMEDIRHKEKRHKKEGKTSPFPYKPLYNKEDVANTIPLFKNAPYKKPFDIAKGITASFFEAGHIFGSTMIKLSFTSGDEQKTILFSGDVGRWDVPIIEDPTQFEQADYVVMESTYGNRLHKPVASIPDELERVINDTYKKGGNLIIPSFAVERTQELLYHMSELLNDGRIPNLVTFIDSPMAIRVTDIFRNHEELFDKESMDLIREGGHPCDFPGLITSKTVSESKSINQIKGVAVIIAGSGMCTGGRVKHHLRNNIQRKESTILFVGYQAYGTLGRVILEKPEKVRLFGKEYYLNADIEKINGFSGHADKEELYKWISSLKNTPEKVFVTHGEPEAAEGFKNYLHEKTGWNCVVPKYMDEVILT
jgi:metallo-beta-lactamase family protein